MTAFDFSEFHRENVSTREFSDLGLNQEQTMQLLQQDCGLSRTLMGNFADITMRGHQPKKFVKAGIVWERSNRNCSIQHIANSLECSPSAAHSNFAMFADAISKCYKLQIHRSNEANLLSDNNTLQASMERVTPRIKAVEKGIKLCVDEINSIEKCGGTVVLPQAIAPLILAYKNSDQASALPANDQEVA